MSFGGVSPGTNDAEREALFFIADISGYTKFIFSNEKEISHSQMVIRELITTLMDRVNLPLRLRQSWPISFQKLDLRISRSSGAGISFVMPRYKPPPTTLG